MRNTHSEKIYSIYKNYRTQIALLTLLFTVVNPAVAQAVPAGDTNVNEIVSFATIHQQAFFFDVMMASIIGWIIGITKGFSSSRQWLSNYLKNTPVVVVFILDLLIFVVVGAYVGTGVYQPTNFVAALGAGITWPVALGTLASKKASPKSEGAHDV